MIKPILLNDKEAGLKRFNELNKDEEKYFNTDPAYSLNYIGYELLAENKTEKAIEIFEFAVKKFPKNANLFDSLGQAYFENQDYKKSLENYKISLELNPDNKGAKKYLKQIESILK